LITRLPSLEALRYFECAARHLNFTIAAEELCVSQSAVSQKITLLEEVLNYKVFERKPLKLTINGEQLFQSVSFALNEMLQTINRLDCSAPKMRLELYCLPSFTSCWLMPRINEFYKTHPEIDLNLNVSLAVPNFQNKEVDIGICHRLSDHPTMKKELLFQDYIYPVASPELLKKHPLLTLDDLRGVTLLHDSIPQAKLSTSWHRWLSELNIKNIDANEGYKYNQLDLIVQAAIDGQGVALGRHSLVSAAIKSGRLVPLFGHVIEDEGVYLVHLKKLIERPEITFFKDWIKQQAKQYKKHHDITDIMQIRNVSLKSSEKNIDNTDN
jgi:LysR family glycine cleavage system transcriptional activator